MNQNDIARASFPECHSLSEVNNTIMDNHLIVNRSRFFIFSVSFWTGKSEIRHCTAEKSLVHGHLGRLFLSPSSPIYYFPFHSLSSPKLYQNRALDGSTCILFVDASSVIDWGRIKQITSRHLRACANTFLLQ